MPDTLVIQPHRTPLPSEWIAQCLEIAQAWARSHAMVYRFVGDELFNLLPADLREKTANQRVVADDLGRLLTVREAIEEVFNTVI